MKNALPILAPLMRRQSTKASVFIQTIPPVIELREILRRVLDSKVLSASLIVKRAASVALIEPGADHSDSDRALLESLIDGDLPDGWKIGGGRGLNFVLPDKRLDRLVSGWSRVKAEKAIRSEEAIRLGTHSGKPTAWELTFDLVLAAIFNRTVGYSNPKIVAELLEELLWNLALGKPLDWEEGEEHIAALQREGFGRNLLEELWKQCPGEAAEMKLPRVDVGTKLQGVKTLSTLAGLEGGTHHQVGTIPSFRTLQRFSIAEVIDSMSKYQKNSITLEEMLIRVHRRAKELSERIDRRACKLRAETDRGGELSAELRATLLEVAEGKQPIDIVRNNNRLNDAFGDWNRDKAKKELLREYADSLGQPPHRKTAWEVVMSAFFEGAERLVDGFKVNEGYGDWWERQFRAYCESLSTGTTTLSADRAELFRQAGEALETPSFVRDVLDQLARECLEEAKDLQLLNFLNDAQIGGGTDDKADSPISAKPITTLSPSAWVILKRLVKSPTVLFRKDLAGKADPNDATFLLPNDEETIGDHITELIDRGFAIRAKGPRSGVTATEVGLQYVIDHPENTAL